MNDLLMGRRPAFREWKPESETIKMSFITAQFRLKKIGPNPSGQGIEFSSIEKTTRHNSSMVNG
jgi:hypothetical protein